MTITLYLQQETLLRDLQTVQHIFQTQLQVVERLKPHYPPLNISLHSIFAHSVCIQVTIEEFSKIGVFNGEFK